jgi:D-alanyl-D-alanine carboxypeptidase (penicillin-binding protein 5/6)
MKVVAVYDGPVKAPVATGQPVGKLVVTAADTPAIEIPLAATASVGRLGGFGRIALAAGYLVYGKR